MKADARALAVQSAGLFRAAEHLAAVNLAHAQQAGSAGEVVTACTRQVSIALDCDRPRAALRWGTQALPLALGSRPVAPEIRARLFINLAKAAWTVGVERDFLAYVDAAASIVEYERVSARIQAHCRTVQGLAAANQGDWQGARALTRLALDLAVEVADVEMKNRCRLNLGYLSLESGAADESEAWLAAVVQDAGAPKADVAEALGDSVRTALAMGDLRLAAVRLRRLLEGYLAAPSRLSPQALGYLYEAIGSYYQHRGFGRAAAAMWRLAAGWFGKRGRDRDVERVRSQAAPAGHGPDAAPALDPDLVYLGRLFAASWQGETLDADFQVAVAVNRILPAIAPAAAPVPTEHAAMLRAVGPVAPLLTARSSAGRAAVRVLAGEDEAAREALDVIAAYEHLCSAGLGWTAVIRSLRNARLAHEPVRALDRLYQQLVA